MDIKDTNPKDAIGSRKAPTFNIPAEVTGEIGLALLEGSLKYGAYNWRVAGVRASVYLDALNRHLGAWKEGEDTDQESGVSHLIKAIACLVILRDAQLQFKLNDDRPPKSTNPGWIHKQNLIAANIIDKTPDPTPPYTQLGEQLP